MSANAREEILAAAKLTAQAHGYAVLNFRNLAEQVGIKAASIYYHFPGKADGHCGGEALLGGCCGLS
ncbi:AcrR family transcriptional regulator [Granulicella aggregans]|uniref:AcrR family transcriptional regulator n=1 Tax=Granulicella aggregans TaxID=474949 RepID=A0A7W7ZDY0_9BACT|nr:TetR/AcrR family transcriptional regulator [Granulicella aggregans]MBB5057973.1 AcrR family transcriptional regulator [Granulicella aggregans]